jgi:flagellar motility protein MotE (MotC chaperone)
MVYERKAIAKMPSYIANRKGETLMKTALVRILTIATLATSLSAFAAADEPKTDNAAGASATQQQTGCAASHKEKKQKKAKSQRDDQRTEQEKEFDRVLMGYFG